ncbi:hypothetical protein J6590_073745 [Homalodisca vitripennis]|nr:hypothetical protein J6590_073745 [Homalodisca vitripennis]
MRHITCGGSGGSGIHHRTTSFPNDTGGSLCTSDVSRAQHSLAELSVAQLAPPMRYQGLNTPIQNQESRSFICPAGSTHPCGGVGSLTRPCEVSNTPHKNNTPHPTNTPM